jgi:SNF2 family DNA or RNA helicase
MKAPYHEFLERKSQLGGMSGFEPIWMPDFLFEFQRTPVEWAIRKGRAAILADCGLGKTPMQLVWAENVRRHTNKPVLILTPLAVAHQTEREAKKFGIEAKRSPDGKHGNEIVITNYERLHLFESSDFAGVVCDESSILKAFTGSRRKQITRFMNKMKYRLLCTATAAPNDYVELGNSSEALGELNYSDMLKRFFQQLDDKGQKRELKLQLEAETLIERDPNYFKKLAYRVAQTIGQWRLKHHAVTHFWRWVASWAKAFRKPSDLGFSDDGFILPALRETHHVIEPKTPPKGMLFNVPAFGMSEERAERRRTMDERCEFVANLVNHKRPAVVWCQMNDEADRLEDMIADAEQIAGRTPDDRKVELYEAFAKKKLRVLIIKPKIGAFGLNWQHCNHVVTFASHSYEQYYQSVRRCWRFGQKNPVDVDIIATEGEVRIIDNMRHKAKKADAMFDMLVREMGNATRVVRDEFSEKMEVPWWLSATK